MILCANILMFFENLLYVYDLDINILMILNIYFEGQITLVLLYINLIKKCVNRNPTEPAMRERKKENIEE